MASEKVRRGFNIRHQRFFNFAQRALYENRQYLLQKMLLFKSVFAGDIHAGDQQMNIMSAFVGDD